MIFSISKFDAASKAAEMQSRERIALIEQETERMRLAAAQARDARSAREQSQVVDSLAQGLGRLSNGDLTVRLDQPFAQHRDREVPRDIIISEPIADAEWLAEALADFCRDQTTHDVGRAAGRQADQRAEQRRAADSGGTWSTSSDLNDC